MHQTLDFLTIIDDKIKRSHHGDNRRLQAISTRERVMSKRNHRYPYAKAIDFRESKYNGYPRWLTEKEGFSDFIYKSYEKKLMSIPLICQKEQRESDEKYFVDLYLQEIPIFKNIPPSISEIVLDNLKTRYYKAGEVIHEEGSLPAFMGLIFVGEVEFRMGKKMVVREKNSIILKDAFQGRSHPTIVCREQTILLTLDSTLWGVINNTIKRQMQDKEIDEIGDTLKSAFFSELHIKNKKAQQFYQSFKVQFYFHDQVIQEAGSEEKAFYFLYKGSILEENHIYVREHNKWPLPNRRWEVRAVYNSYHQNKVLKRFDFFGDEQMMENLKFKAKYVATSWTILLKMSSEDFFRLLNQEDIKRLKKYRAENANVNYTDFESSVRARAKSTSEKKKIVLKAINASLNYKSNFSPKRMALIGNYQKNMLRQALTGDRTISF